MKAKTKFLIAGVGLLLLGPIAAGAVSSTANTTITAALASTISVTSSSTLTLNVTPASGGSQTTDKDVVSVTTNNATGYALTLSDTDSNNNLVNGGNTIAATTGTYASPVILPNNSWGYRVDSLGSFGAGPTTATTNQTSNALLFAAVPVLASPQQIKTTATTASSDVTNVWYSVKVDGTKPNGNYSDQVVYTATTNP